MCKTYNMIGSLATLKLNLEEENIYDLKSLKEVVNFQNSYPILRSELISTHEEIIEKEKNLLSTDLLHLDTIISTERKKAEQRLTVEIDNLKQRITALITDEPINLLSKLKKKFIDWNNKRILQNKERYFDIEVIKSIKNLIEIQQVKKNRLEFIETQFDLAVNQSAQTDLSEIDRKKSVIDNSNNYIYGALGEQKVVKTLGSLSDDYYLINDFDVSFTSAIYNRRDNDYIKSIQIDHLLVSQSGIFLIETKNWSEKSLQSLSLRSPVEQIRRTSFVLFKLLNNKMNNYNLHLDNHHWGDKKISIKNLIVLTNSRPKEEFQYVKILKLNELLSYIDYFKPIFSNIETQRIAEFLIEINTKKTVETQ